MCGESGTSGSVRDTAQWSGSAFTHPAWTRQTASVKKESRHPPKFFLPFDRPIPHRQPIPLQVHLVTQQPIHLLQLEASLLLGLAESAPQLVDLRFEGRLFGRDRGAEGVQGFELVEVDEGD